MTESTEIKTHDAMEERRLIVARIRRDAQMSAMLVRFGGDMRKHDLLTGIADAIEAGEHMEEYDDE